MIDADRGVAGAVAQPLLEQVVVESPEIVGDAPQFVSGTVRLGGPAPAGGLEVALVCDRPDVVAVPAAVGIAEGQQTAGFAGSVARVEERVVAQVTATLGETSRSAELVIHAPGEAVGPPVAARPNGTAVQDGAALARPAVALLPAADGAVAPAISGSTLTTSSLAPSTTAAPAIATPAADGAATPFAALAAAADALDWPWQPACKQSFRAALLGVLPVVPFVAIITMIAIYAAPPGTPLSAFDPLLAGTLCAVVVGLVAGFLRWRIIQDTSAERANAASFDEVRERLATLTARLSLAAQHIDADPGNQMALREAQAARAQILTELTQAGPGWVDGSAYLNVWKLVHRAEEALVELTPMPQLVAAALYDEQRLSGSQMDNRDQLLARLRLAVARLDAAGLVYLNQPPAPVVGDGGPAHTDADAEPGARQTARSILREVRATINEFRDESWAGIVRTRNHLMRTLTVTGLVTYLGLVMALDLSPKTAALDARTDAIVAAAVFYLVGAMVGLFNRLSSESSTDHDVEDYGLTEARVSLTPVLSGLAAVGGVYLTAMVTGTLTGVTGAASTNPAGLVLPSVSAVFNLSASPFGVMIAAAFGLSPTMLISSLQAQADKYKGALQSTAPHG